MYSIEYALRNKIIHVDCLKWYHRSILYNQLNYKTNSIISKKEEENKEENWCKFICFVRRKEMKERNVVRNDFYESLHFFFLNFFLSLQIHNIILITLEVLIFFFFVKLFYILIINYWFIVYKDKIVKYSLFIIIYSLFLATFSSPLHTNTHRLEQLMWLVQGVISTSYFFKYKPQKEKKFYYIVIHKIIFNDI